MPTIVPVASADDPRLADYRDIRDRDIAGRAGAFVAEGAVVLDVLIRRSRFRTRSVMIVDKRLGSLEPLLGALAADVPVYTVPQRVADTVGGFALNRGILAIGERVPSKGDLSSTLAGLPARALVVVLVGLANHDNVGGIFRNAAAFGAALVLLDRTSCDPLYRKAIRVSVGAALTVPFLRGGEAPGLLGALERADFTLFAFSPRGDSLLSDARFPARTALVFGAEGHGLPDDVLARTRTIRIPIAPEVDSLNVATTSGIALYATRTVMADAHALA